MVMRGAEMADGEIAYEVRPRLGALLLRLPSSSLNIPANRFESV